MGNLTDMPKIQVYYNTKSPKQTEYYNNFKRQIIKKIGVIAFSFFDVKNSEFCIKLLYGEETYIVQDKFDGNADAIEKTCKRIETILNQIKEREEKDKLNTNNKKNDNIKNNDNKNNKNNNIYPKNNYDNENEIKNKSKKSNNETFNNNKNKLNDKEKNKNIEKEFIIKNEDRLHIDSVRKKENKINFNKINNIQIKKNNNKITNDKINDIQNKENINKIICERINDIQILNNGNNKEIISDKKNNESQNKNKESNNKIIKDKINDIQNKENNNNIYKNINYKFKSNETTVITYYNTRSPKQTDYYNNFKDEIKKKLYINNFSIIDIKKNADFCIKLKCGDEIITVQERFDGTKNAIDKIRKKMEDLVEINKNEEKINLNENIYNKLQVNKILDINDNVNETIINKKKKKKKKKKLFRSK